MEKDIASGNISSFMHDIYQDVLSAEVQENLDSSPQVEASEGDQQGSSEDQNQQQTTETTPEVVTEADSWQPPDWLGESFRPTGEDYREAYRKLVDHVGSEDFAEGFARNYEQQITGENAALRQQMEELRAFKNDPEGFVKAYMPALAHETGIPASLSPEQADLYINQEMVKLYGENWQDLHDPSETFKFGSVSNRIEQSYRELQNKVLRDNELAEAKREAYLKTLSEKKTEKVQQENLTEEKIREIFDAQYKDFEAEGISRKEFDAWVETTKKNPESVGPKNYLDLWKLQNLSKLLEDAREAGRKEGSKEVAREIRKATPTSKNESGAEVKEESKPKLTGNYLLDRKHFTDGHLL